MKRFVILLLATVACMGVHAQTFEELTSWEQTFKSRLTEEQLKERREAHMREIGGRQNTDPATGRQTFSTFDQGESMGKLGLDILPDTLYAGEPFDVHYALGSEGEATYELYDLSGKRPKRIATEYASTLINGYTVLRIILDEPGAYEVVAYNAANPMNAPDLEMTKSRWKIVVHDRNAPVGE